MSWIVMSIFFGLLVVLAAKLGPQIKKIAPRGEEANYATTSRVVGWGAIAVVMFLWMIFTLTSIVHSIDRGHDGLVETFGKITGHRQNGLAFTWPWQDVEIVNVQQQSICADGKAPEGSSCQAQYEPFSKESIDVHVKAVITYQVDSNDIQALYTNIGPNYVNKIILPNMNQILKEEVVKYPAVEIVPNRQDITDRITARMTPILKQSAIQVVNVNLTNIDFDDSVKKAIEQKVIAAQQAQAAQAQVAVAEAEAAKAIATAKGAAEVNRQTSQGAADSQLIKARAEADSNNLINASLTGNLLTLESIRKLNPTIQSVVVPAGNGNVNVLDLGNLFTRPAAPAPAAPTAAR